MAIIIQNISPQDSPKDGVNTYQLRINNRVMCEFTHDRSKGLAVCLEEAAKAYRNEEWANLRRMMKELDAR